MFFEKRIRNQKRIQETKQQKGGKRVTTYIPIGEGWHKQGPKVKFKSLRLFPEAVSYINRVLKSGQPINLTVMPNPKFKMDGNETPLKVFLVFTGIAKA